MAVFQTKLSYSVPDKKGKERHQTLSFSVYGLRSIHFTEFLYYCSEEMIGMQCCPKANNEFGIAVVEPDLKLGEENLHEVEGM